MNGEFWLVRQRSEIDGALKFFKKQLENWDFEKPIAWKLTPFSDRRSINQNSLFHLWCAEMSMHFSQKVPVSAEDMKTILKNNFLGLEDVVIGNTIIPAQLKSTRKLLKGEMHQFMEQVFHWGIDHGVTLTYPQESEFYRARNPSG